MAASSSENYGVEMEFVFAFQEKELSLGNSKIQKDLSYGTREQYPKFTPIPATILPNHAYNSWGVMDSGATEVRPYKTEPQRILQIKLSQTLPNIPSRIFGTIYGQDKTNEKMKYDKWAITVDHTVCGVGSSNIPTHLPNRNIDPREWDSYGLELVSPVLNAANPTHKRDIKELVEAIAGTPRDNHGAFITNQCGLHVHIEASKDLEVLKELAILLVIYEEEISRLHPAARRPGHAATTNQLDSNRLYFLHGGDLDFDETKANWVGGDFSTAALKKAYNIPRLRGRMNLIKKKEALSQRMCWPCPPDKPNGDRRRLVNFTYLTRGKGYAETIEFRQARGSLDAEEINHWVDFCIGLVKLAELYVRNPDRFPVKSFDDVRQNEGTPENSLGIFKLMRDMGLSEEAIQFWYKKIQQYKNYQPGGIDDRSDNEAPPTNGDFEDDFDFENLMGQMNFPPQSGRDQDDRKAFSTNKDVGDSTGEDLLEYLDGLSSSGAGEMSSYVCLRGGGIGHGRRPDWVNRDWGNDHRDSPYANANSFYRTCENRPEPARITIDIGVPRRQQSLEKGISGDGMSFEVTGSSQGISSRSKKRSRSSISGHSGHSGQKRNLPHPLHVRDRRPVTTVDRTRNRDKNATVIRGRQAKRSWNRGHQVGAYSQSVNNQHKRGYKNNSDLFVEPVPRPDSLSYSSIPPPPLQGQPLVETRKSYYTTHPPSAQHNQITGTTASLLAAENPQLSDYRTGLPGFAPIDVDTLFVRAEHGPGIIAAEPMAQDNSGWFVSNYDSNQWRSISTGSWIYAATYDEERCNVCGILALINSFNAQYPNSCYANMDPAILLDVFDSVVNDKRVMLNAQDEEMQLLVDIITDCEFAIVVVDAADLTKRARRVGIVALQEQRRLNLFLKHVPGHWEGMVYNSR